MSSRTGWLAAFGSEGYEGEPSLMEELGVNFDHIRQKVSKPPICCWQNVALTASWTSPDLSTDISSP